MTAASPVSGLMASLNRNKNLALLCKQATADCACQKRSFRLTPIHNRSQSLCAMACRVCVALWVEDTEQAAMARVSSNKGRVSLALYPDASGPRDVARPVFNCRIRKQSGEVGGRVQQKWDFVSISKGRANGFLESLTTVCTTTLFFVCVCVRGGE